MTGPDSGEPAAGTQVPLRTVGRRDTTRAIGILLAAGFALRFIIAYLLPGSGLSFDIGAFEYWAGELAANGPVGFYDRGFFADYTPGYLYVLWLVGLVGQGFNAIGVEQVGPFTGIELLKLPSILADLAIGWLLWRMTLELGGGRRAALLAAGLYVFNPISWFDSTIWGQVDSFGVVFVLLSVRALWRDQPERAALWATVAAVIKPQLGILVPIVAAVVIRRYVFDTPPERRFRVPDSVRGLFRERTAFRVVTTGLVGLLTASLLALPFGLTIVGLLGQVVKTAGGYPYLSVNAYNPWALISQDGHGVAADSTWIRDADGAAGEVGFMIGPLPAVVVGTALLLLVVLAVAVAVALRPDRRTILVGVTVLAVAFFVVPTRVHERYMFPFFALAAILAATSGRWRTAYVALSVATFANMYVVLTTLYPGNPGIQDWLGLGELIKSFPGVALIALIHAAGFIWCAFQLRSGALERLGAEIAATAGAVRRGIGRGALAGPSATPDGARWRPDPALEPSLAAPTDVRPGMAAAASAPTEPEPPNLPSLPARGDWLAQPPPDQPGRWAGIRRGLLVTPRRPDRSGTLVREGGGRIDRLDALIFVVLIVATLGLRTFRLAEPYSMHFDEVYHARTATEFLQDWRYDRPHDIYEYTHPHLAKYAMALGIIAWGDNQVTSTSNLGTGVRDAAIELRWDDRTLPGARAGDRVIVATGTDVRSYSLETRALETAIPIDGAVAVAVDQGTHRLFVGTETGQILLIDTSVELDPLRTGADPMALDPPFALADVGVPVTELLFPPTGDALVVATAADQLISIDASSGEELGRTDLPGLRGMVQAGTSNHLLAEPALIEDVPAAVSRLAGILGQDAAELEARLGGGQERVILGPAPTASARTDLDQAIADGELPGISIESLPLVAAIDDAGLTFVAVGNGLVSSTVEIAGATGAAWVTGLERPSIYVAAGENVLVVELGDGSTGDAPAIARTLTAPGAVRDVTFDASTTAVHVLGQTPDGSASTIYVIEPHGNAFFADARLPFDPVAWATDAQPQYPSADRQAILAFSADGAVASVDIGSNPFAWRLPGVIAGALLAGLLYLLARILFRRRSVALLAGAFGLFDGMMFVQSRIGMNDVYVGLFIVAAYTLFAALWMGMLRGRWAFWIAMPIVGVLLGLGLSAKWVALYAVAGLGVLILARSALGRLVLIVGMIGASTVLGYMALNVPTGATGGGNLGFVLIMVALTLASVLASVLHPIAWSAEEVRFAVGAPVAAAAVMVLLALPLGAMNTTFAVAGVGLSPLTIAMLLALTGGGIAAAFWIAGRLGFGPLAPLPRTEPGYVAPPPAAPAAEGWLRLGSGFGLPVVWMAVSLVIIPIGVYVISYLPWVALGNRLLDGWPAGNTGQTLIDLTKSMYDYHNNLRASHAASSPWWAWPFDLKPVWFYQGSFAGSTAASIYDAGNIAIWWLGIPAMAFTAWQAWRRRSLALALIAIGFAFQWLSWSRIDRATFQYHYFTSLPFVFLGLAYFVAELWHGPSRGTWLLARIAAAVAIIGPALLWVGKGPLCRFVRVEDVNPGSLACVGNPGDLVVTARVAGLVLVMGVAVVLLVSQLLTMRRPAPGESPTRADRQRLMWLLLTGVGAWLGVVAATTLLGEGIVFEMRGFQSSWLALVVGIPLVLIAAFIVTARDAKRFAMGFVFAAAMAFVVIYPNISALPLPSTIVNAYQGLLPTYLYPFQFPVNTDPAAPSIRLLAAEPILLAIALSVTCLVVGYAAWVWRIGPIQRPPGPDGLAPADG